MALWVYYIAGTSLSGSIKADQAQEGVKIWQVLLLLDPPPSQPIPPGTHYPKEG